MVSWVVARTPANELQTEVARRLAAVEQRYTSGRRELVEVLERSDRPLTVPEILDAAGAFVVASVVTGRRRGAGALVHPPH